METRRVALMESDPRVDRAGQLQYRGGLVLASSDKRFGGFSGLMVSPDGTRLLAVSAGGYWLTADIASKAGRLAGLSHASLAPMLNGDGAPLPRHRADAQAVMPADEPGAVLVAYGREPRVWRYAFARDGFAARPAAAEMPAARDPALITRPGGDYKPAAIAAAPGGDLFLLERRFSLSRGPAIQIRRIGRTEIRPGVAPDGEILAQLDIRYSIDNIEALAVRTGSAGETLLYLLSNDNFSGLQRTLLLEFAWPAPGTRLAAR